MTTQLIEEAIQSLSCNYNFFRLIAEQGRVELRTMNNIVTYLNNNVQANPPIYSGHHPINGLVPDIVEYDGNGQGNNNVIKTLEAKHYSPHMGAQLAGFIVGSLEGPACDFIKQLRYVNHCQNLNRIFILQLQTEILYSVPTIPNYATLPPGCFIQYLAGNNQNGFVANLNMVKNQLRILWWIEFSRHIFGNKIKYGNVAKPALIGGNIFYIMLHYIISEFDPDPASGWNGSVLNEWDFIFNRNYEDMNMNDIRGVVNPFLAGQWNMFLVANNQSAGDLLDKK